MLINLLLTCMVGVFPILWLWDFGKRLGLKAGAECPKGDGISTKTELQAQGKTELLLFAKVFGLALLFRLLLYVLGGFLFCVYAEGADYTLRDYLSCWNRWDGPHYLDIAQKGYANCIEDGQHLFLVFFPLYPWLIRFLGLLGGDLQLCGMILSTVAYAVGAGFFYLTISEEYNPEVAEKSIVLLSISPFAFFFGAVMTEGLFFCLLSTAFFCIRRHKWWMVGLLGLLCALCRAQGVIVLGVGAVEFLVSHPPITYLREKRGRAFLRELFAKASFLLLIPVGNLVYLWINYRVEGDPFRFVFYQKDHWHLGPTFFTNTIREISSYLFRPETSVSLKACIWLPEFLLFFLTFAALYYGRKRHPLKYTAFLYVYTMINYSVTWLVSGGRYMLCALPLFVILGELVSRHKKVYPWLIAGFSILMAIYLGGFFAWKSVM